MISKVLNLSRKKLPETCLSQHSSALTLALTVRFQFISLHVLSSTSFYPLLSSSRLLLSSPVPRCSTTPLGSTPLPVWVTASLVYLIPLRTRRGAAVTLFSIRGWSLTNVSTLSGSFRDDSKPSAFNALFKHYKKVEGRRKNVSLFYGSMVERNKRNCVKYM